MTQSLVELFACHADERAEHIFITERDTGTSFTYGEAITRVVSAAHFFTQRGVHRGDRVAMLMENRMEWVTTFLAAQSIGAMVVPLNTRLTSEELQSHIDDCDPKAIVIDSRHTGVIGSDDPRIVECSQLPVDHNLELSLAGSADDPAVIAYNRFAASVDRLAVRYESFIEEFTNILQRKA